VSAFVDLDAEVAGLQAWLECVATPVAGSALPDPGELESTVRWEDVPPSGIVLDAIAGHDLGALTDDELLSACAAMEKSGSWQQAIQARVLAEFASRRPGYLGETPASLFDEAAGDEVATVLHLAPRTGATRLDWAIELTRRLPKTLAGMERGEVSGPGRAAGRGVGEAGWDGGILGTAPGAGRGRVVYPSHRPRPWHRR